MRVRNLQLGQRLTFLTPQMKSRLSAILSELDEKLMPHSVAILLGIEYSEALLLLAVLGREGVCSNRLLVYHNCEPAVPAGSIPFGRGYPKMPWRCRHCEQEVEDLDELSFDLEAVVVDTAELT